MDLFMPAERVLYNRSYYFSDEAVDDYNEYIADRDGVNIDVVSSLDFFMNEVWKEIDYAIDNDLSDEISCFDRMLRDLKCGGDPEHPTEISVVAKGTVERWDEPSRGLVVADSLLPSYRAPAARMPSRIAKSTASWIRTASSISRPPIMTAPLIWTSGSSPGSRTMPRGSSSAANIMRPAKWTWSISISS